MASTLIKLTSILVMMNIMIYLGMNLAITAEGEEVQQEGIKFHLEGDLLQKLVFNSVEDITASTKDNFTDYDINVTSDFTTFPSLTGGQETSGGGGISFVDVIAAIGPFAKMLFNIATSPLTLMTSFRIPAIFAILIGIPYFIIFVITAMAFLRGVGD